jgi:phosphopentomutase
MPLDMGIVAGAMAALNFEPDVVAQVVALLETNSEQLDQQGRSVTRVPADWFGGAPTAHRIGVNTSMAHEAVEEEFQKLAASLQQYGAAIAQWGNDVRDVNDTTAAEMQQRRQALEQVRTTIENATQEAADREMGDGIHSQPPATGGGS